MDWRKAWSKVVSKYLLGSIDGSFGSRGITHSKAWRGETLGMEWRKKQLGLEKHGALKEEPKVSRGPKRPRKQLSPKLWRQTGSLGILSRMCWHINHQSTHTKLAQALTMVVSLPWGAGPSSTTQPLPPLGPRKVAGLGPPVTATRANKWMGSRFGWGRQEGGVGPVATASVGWGGRWQAWAERVGVRG